MTAGVYWIYQPSQDRALYVGSSQHIDRRFAEHKWDLRASRHCNPHLQAVWNKYGAADMQFLTLEACPVEHLIEREQFWMTALGPACNIAEIAGSSRGRITSAEVRQKQSAAQKGRVFSEEHRRKISAAKLGKARPPASEAQKAKASAALKGRKTYVVTDETRRRMSEAAKKRHNLREP